jgi:hypothetical protein
MDRYRWRGKTRKHYLQFATLNLRGNHAVGNILLNPKASFLFIDFDNGDLVYMIGQAKIVWDNKEIETFTTGAEHLIRFRAEQVTGTKGSLPLHFDFDEYWPMLERTGSWT